jgi:hypothetical protein
MTDNNNDDHGGVYAQNNNRDIVDLALDLRILQEYIDPDQGLLEPTDEFRAFGKMMREKIEKEEGWEDGWAVKPEFMALSPEEQEKEVRRREDQLAMRRVRKVAEEGEEDEDSTKVETVTLAFIRERSGRKNNDEEGAISPEVEEKLKSQDTVDMLLRLVKKVVLSLEAFY